MVTIKINGRKVKAEEGSTILENAQKLKIEIPTLYGRGEDEREMAACGLLQYAG